MNDKSERKKKEGRFGKTETEECMTTILEHTLKVKDRHQSVK